MSNEHEWTITVKYGNGYHCYTSPVRPSQFIHEYKSNGHCTHIRIVLDGKPVEIHRRKDNITWYVFRYNWTKGV